MGVFHFDTGRYGKTRERKRVSMTRYAKRYAKLVEKGRYFIKKNLKIYLKNIYILGIYHLTAFYILN